MDSSILFLIAIGGICLIFVVGFILRVINQRGKKKNNNEKEKSKISNASNLEIKTKSKPKSKSKPKKAPSRSLTEVANLWRDNRNGRLVFQIEDQIYKRGDELTNSEREILLKIVMDFYRWLEPPSSISSDVNGSDKPESATASLPNSSEQLNLQSQTTFEASKASEEAESGGLTTASFISRALRSDVTVPPPTSQSMVTQVDEILQEKLIAADMQKWAVRLAEFPNRGMTVLVGLEKYDGIDDVPYERVRAVIRESVSEWERRAENGELAS